MAKESSFVCTECTGLFTKWTGQCPSCGAWNTIEKQSAVLRQNKAISLLHAGDVAEIQTVSEISFESQDRTATTLAELDRVLGGGIVTGSVVLVGGNPGIGKSTLLLQVLCALDHQRALYVTGEESLQQVALRAERLGYKNAPLRVLASTRLEEILACAMRERPSIMVIDSIQSLASEKTPSAAGSISQVRECANRVTQFAKQTDTTVFMIGHVTKEGSIAGPRVLEHVVDTVLYFEGDDGGRYRVLRAAKNRFGAVNELGVFVMQDTGLKGVKNPSAIFLSRHANTAPGSVITVTCEATRPLLLEVQALVEDTPATHPRRVAIGIDQNRLTMLLAILHRHGGVDIYDKDVFVNIVGGVQLKETGADLAVLLATYSSFKNRTLDRGLAAFGEIGLTGEVRPVYNGLTRLKEAREHGVTKAIIPEANQPKTRLPGLEVIAVRQLGEAVGHIA
ncbi:MAG: DNA repair protein RadA [Gammaproteobacteria bacterium]|nr:DNA repair protein RadA [Gammaproteobacteria bacterium]